MSVNDYFTIQYGQKEYHSKLNLRSGKTPLISSSATDNGFYGYFDIEPKFRDAISYPSTGSVGEARVHDYPCCIDDNCLVLIPKMKLSKNQLYYAASVLQNNKWRFKYGRQATELRIKNIALPLMEKINKAWNTPKVDIDNASPSLSQTVVELNGQLLGDLFFIVKGKGCYFEKCKKGNTPMISASEVDNSVIGFVDLAPTFKAPCLTIERVSAKVHVQTVDFVTVPDDIFVLKPKRSFTVDELFFIAAILNVNRWRFSYSRKVTKSRLERIQFHISKEKKRLESYQLEDKNPSIVSLTANPDFPLYTQ